MKIQIWSDVMCPFCYIGKKNFEAALETLPFKDEVEVEWKSFQLDPELTETSGLKTTSQYLSERKGLTIQQVNQMQQQVTEMGEKAGIHFDFYKNIIANTFLAHKLIHFAAKNNKANDAEELLFKAHFENGENIANVSVLLQIATTLGLNTEETKEVLTTNLFDNEVNNDILEAKNIGVSGVPFFVLNNKYALSGAQPTHLFAEALTQTYNETVLTNEAANGNSCSINGCE